MNITKIRKRRAALDKVISTWTEDASTPPNYIRETGMGKEIARVDTHMGGYQWAHTPLVVGWRAQIGPHRSYGIVVVADYTKKEDAIRAAKRKADVALKELLA